MPVCSVCGLALCKCEAVAQSCEKEEAQLKDTAQALGNGETCEQTGAEVYSNSAYSGDPLDEKCAWCSQFVLFCLCAEHAGLALSGPSGGQASLVGATINSDAAISEGWIDHSSTTTEQNLHNKGNYNWGDKEQTQPADRGLFPPCIGVVAVASAGSC